MKRVIATVVTALAFAGVLAVPAAQAKCNSFKCVGKEISSLQNTVRAQQKVLKEFAKCFGELPVGEYGDNQGGTFGYVYDDGTGNVFDTGALSVSNSGDTPGAWVLVDRCNTATAARDMGNSIAGAARRALGVVVPSLPVIHKHR